MCSHYEAPSHPQIMKAFGVEGPEQGRLDLWPTYMGPFLRRPDREEAQDEPGPALEMLSGSFGLIPSWAKDTKIARRTYNARSETAAKKPSFRSAWKKSQHCIIPAAIYEPDWRSGKAIPRANRPGRRRTAGHRRAVGVVEKSRGRSDSQLFHGDDQCR